MTTNLLKPGTEIFGYKVIEYITEGGWGHIYKAEDLSVHRYVAIKQLKRERLKDDLSLKRFRGEANIIAGLSNHPNIVTLHKYEQDEETDSYYIIQEFAEAGTLENRIKHHSNGLPFDEIIHLATGLCKGLAAIHSKGITHRDIKPSNVLLFDSHEKYPVPKLCDFGIARIIEPSADNSYKTLGFNGTPSYMSPEQFEEDPDQRQIDHRSDIYSLGILLYEITSGERPFSGEQHDIKDQHNFHKPRSIETIPASLDKIILKCLEKDTEDRYQSANNVLSDIEGLKQGTHQSVNQLLRQSDRLLEEGGFAETIDILENIRTKTPAPPDISKRLNTAWHRWKTHLEHQLNQKKDEVNQISKLREDLQTSSQRELNQKQNELDKKLQEVKVLQDDISEIQIQLTHYQHKYQALDRQKHLIPIIIFLTLIVGGAISEQLQSFRPYEPIAYILLVAYAGYYLWSFYVSEYLK